MNGDSLPAPRILKAGVHHRLRFVVIGEVPARVRGWAGQTFDFDFFPTARGEYTLVATQGKTTCWTGTLSVR